MGFWRWLKSLFAFKPKEVREVPRSEEAELPTPEPKPEKVHKGIVSATSVGDVRFQLEKLREQRIKEELLPSPETKRKTHTHSYTPPAEQHRDSISKFMKGKASNRYLKTIKQSPKIKIEEDN